MTITAEAILNAYAQGAFPMADDRGRLRWYTADPRGVLPLDAFDVPRSLRTLVRRGKFEVRINSAFRGVMTACRERRLEQTWISPELIELYVDLHRQGFAHSVETWLDGKLAGGLYGVAMGGVFFGESMFHYVTDASKVALVALVDRLRRTRVRAARHAGGHAAPATVRRGRRFRRASIWFDCTRRSRCLARSDEASAAGFKSRPVSDRGAIDRERGSARDGVTLKRFEPLTVSA